MTELYHYNHNHDPRTGKFTFSRGGGNTLFGRRQKIAAEKAGIKPQTKYGNYLKAEAKRIKKKKRTIPNEEDSREFFKSEAGKAFISDKKVRAIYEKRNNAYNNQKSQDDVYRAGIKFHESIESQIKTMLGPDANMIVGKYYNGRDIPMWEYMMEHVRNADFWGPDSAGGEAMHDLHNEYAWLYWH